MKNFLLLLTFFFLLKSHSQINYYSDCFKGGIVGDGYNAWYTGGVSTISLPIPSGSTIKKALFFSNIYKWQGNIILATDKSITINSVPLLLSESYSLENTFYFSSAQSYVSTIGIDITSYIDPSISTYTINPFINVSPVESPLFSDFYVLVFYENPVSNYSCVDVIINNFNSSNLLNYNITSNNAIDNYFDNGFAAHTSHICDDPNDWYEVLINANSIGEIGGKEDNTNVNCAGVIGSFSYDNGTLTGIGNDLGNTTMNGLDAIANIQPIINGNESFTVTFDYVSNLSPYSNIINQLFFTYTTTCDTFSVSVPNDTTICYGETLQLNVSGGQTYEWSPTTDLSCTDCPNPIFSGDSSRFYTVQIWNNDSCSVVRPIKVNVRPEVKFGNISTIPSDCGTNNGTVTLSAAVGTQTPITFTLNDTLSQTSGTFNNLAEGTYSFHFTDGNGCVSEDTVITVGEINTTIANFTLSPSYGVVPLEVSFNNSSVNATDYEWSINGFAQGNNLSSYTCDTSGTYTIQLIAWQYDPSCADTVVMTVLAIDRIIIPTAFTPDNDGVNDRWVIPNIKEIYPKHLVRIYNRWGTLIYEAPEGKYSTYPWKGIYEDEALPVGSYYFIIDPNDGVTDVLKGIVSIVRE